MNHTLFMTAVAFLGFNAYADTTKPCTMDSKAPCPTPCCAPNVAADGKIQACNTEWLNIDTVTLEAANGNPIAQYTIAYLTSDGADTPMKDDPAVSKEMASKAKAGLEKAAADGHKGACMALAHMHATGCGGGEKNPEMAKKYATMAQKCEAPKH